MARMIGRYEIERELGEGGMATVYLARDPLMERLVVIKVILREFSRDPQFRSRFTREAKIITGLEHDAIVPVYDFGEHEGQPFLVMRYMPGGSLLDRAPNGELALPEIARIIDRVADALDYVHSKGVIHRDLKPANILFDDRGKPYLSDFGIAKLAEGSTQLTGTGLIGTPAYMSPEQARASVVLDRRSDVYALGVIVFQLLTGRLPYEANDAMGMALAHLSEPVPDIRQARPDLPRESDALIRRAMAKKPDERYQTTGQLAADLSLLATQPTLKARGQAGAAAAARPGFPPPINPASPKAAPYPENPKGDISQKPKRLGWLWIGLAAFLSLCVLATLIAGAFTLPGLLTKRTATAINPTLPVSTPTIQVRTQAVPATALPLTATSAPTQPDLASAVPAPSLTPNATLVSGKDGMVLVFVPAGEFLMGSAASDTAPADNEKPQHTVYLDAFWIDQTDVTNAQYALCVGAGACPVPTKKGSNQRASYYGDPQFDNYPVLNVTMVDAKVYCAWAGRQLPTEAQWEKAARGVDGRLYPWGDAAPGVTLLNFESNIGDTTEVGHYPEGASPYGALDMAGNVWQWVSDFYSDKYYSTSPAANPFGPETGTEFVIRGGSWGSVGDGVRAAIRLGNAPTDGNAGITFRCSRAP